jgi:signal transduction histidine kinase
MKDRAVAFGGSCEIDRSSAAGGTRIQWRVPVDAG